MKKILVTGAGGFIGGHLVTRLKKEGFWVRGADIKMHEYRETEADEFLQMDLRMMENCLTACEGIDEVYTLAADMGGAQFVFTKENDAAIMHNSAKININMAEASKICKINKLFYSSSACCYPAYRQTENISPALSEDMAYPAEPDSLYGLEKLYSESLYFAYQRNYGLNVRVARFHNIMGTYGTWGGIRAKAPAAICRKVADVKDGDTIEIFGDGEQTRSFLYVSECVEGICRFVRSDFSGPLNIGSDELVSINQLVEMVKQVAGKPNIKIKHILGPVGIRGRNSDNTLIKQKLNWAPNFPLIKALEVTYPWIESLVKAGIKDIGTGT